jgi:hypothetical protein|tara:strand:+ start:1500 stop:1730 length:231 start_codon:yes stop_codon:yes gene_type:complete
MGYRQKEYKSNGYKLEKIPGRKYHVRELATDQVVQTFGYITEAREAVRKYSLGSGFNGWTPAFFLSKMPEILIEED